MKNFTLNLGLLITIFALASCSTALPAANSVYPAASAQPGAGNPYPATSGQPGDGNPYPTFSAQSASAYPNSTEVNIALPPEPPSTAPEPEAGKASISGALYSGTSKIRLAVNYAYITLVPETVKDQPDPLLGALNVAKGDIAFFTDEKGNFEINNVTPGKYIIVVWAPNNWDLAQVSELDTSTLKIDLKADTKNPLGVVYVTWP